MRTSPKLKLKKCGYKECPEMFTQYKSTDKYHSLQCQLKAVAQKEIDNKVSQFKDNLKGHSYYTKLLQLVFNGFIRERDKFKNCICCDKPLTKTYHAGHFFTVGAFPSLRIDEDNCHAQREDCNLHKHGNTGEYAINLPKRIGQERFDALCARRKNLSKLSIPEMIEKISYYKSKTKELKLNGFKPT